MKYNHLQYSFNGKNAQTDWFSFHCKLEFIILTFHHRGNKFQVQLTALVPVPLWRGGKKKASAGRRVAQRLKEEKRLRYKQSTLRIKDFKYGSSLSIFVRKIVSQFSHQTSNMTAEFDSGLDHRGIEGENTVQSVFYCILGRAKYSGRALFQNTFVLFISFN